MACVWEQGSLVLLDRLGPYRRRHRAGPKHEALESLRDYVGKRVAMTTTVANADIAEGWWRTGR